MITSIALPAEFEAYQNDKEESLQSFSPLAKINMIVGSNNSRKSRFMRLLATQQQYEVSDSSVDLRVVNKELEEVLRSFEQTLVGNSLSAAEGVSQESISKLKVLPTKLKTSEDVYTPLRSHLERWKQIRSISSTTNVGMMGMGYTNTNGLAQLFRENAEKGLAILEQVPPASASSAPHRVYIPILRGLRPLDATHTDFYANKTREDYFDGKNDTSSPQIFTGLSFYQSLTDLLLGSNAERKQIVFYQEFISKELFEGHEVVLIPSQKNKSVTIKIGKEKEQPVHLLGDGVQSAIILSYLPFVTQEPTFFFIEEPESHMHPGLQRKVLELFNRSEKHTFFLTTHSNHLLDITIDLQNTSIFTFQKRVRHDEDDDEQAATVVVESVDAGQSSSLEELGVRNSSVFLVNSTIWVEGITDRWYLRAYLACYLRHLEAQGALGFKPEEDVHYAFVEYGGGNITHFSFLDKEEHPIEVERLCARAMVIVDQDGDKKLERKAALEAKLGERLQVLAGREIENTLPPEVVRAVVAAYEKVGENTLPALTLGDYKQEYLGTFIEGWLQKSGTMNRTAGYKSASGTIKDKVEFCDRARKHLRNFDFAQLPLNTQEVTRGMYDFICVCNGVETGDD